MSSGVSDQSVQSSNSMQNAKHIDEINIPWSQQVDEAAYENLSSPTFTSDSGKDNGKSSNFHESTDNCDFQFRGPECENPVVNHYKKRSNFSSSYKSQRNTYRQYATDEENIFNEKKINVSKQANNDDDRKKNNQPPKKMTWASIASQPAKMSLRPHCSSLTIKKKGPGMPPPPMVPGKHNMNIASWDTSNNISHLVPPTPPAVIAYPIPEQKLHNIRKENTDDMSNHSRKLKNFENENDDPNRSPRGSSTSQQNMEKKLSTDTGSPWSQKKNCFPSNNSKRSDSLQKNDYINEHPIPNETQLQDFSKKLILLDNNTKRDQASGSTDLVTPVECNLEANPVLDKLRDKNNYNPSELDLEKAGRARFFVIKSYSEDDIHRSIKYEIWCSTDHGNKKLDDAFRERESENGYVFLLFSVNSSGYFCGMAQMLTSVDYNCTSNVWSQDKWRGKFKVKWIYVKDVPNGLFRHIRLENNENRPVTNSRDAQEVPNAKGLQVLKIFHSFSHTTSIFDDFYHYEKRQEAEEVSRKYETHELVNSAEGNTVHNPSYRKVYRERRIDENERDKPINTNKFIYRDRNTYNRGSNYYNDNRRNDGLNRPTGGFEHNDNDHIDRVSVNYTHNRENPDYINRRSQYDFNMREDRDKRLHSMNRDFKQEKYNSGSYGNREFRLGSDNYKDLKDQNRNGRGRAHKN